MKGKWKILLEFFVFFVVCLLGLASCESTPKIAGHVKDFWGAPVSGAKITIVGSAFEDTTDASGQYSVQYVPGSIDLLCTKPGFEEEHKHLNISTPSRFPADDITLMPLPAQTGIALLGKTGLQNIAPAAVMHQAFRTRADPMGVFAEDHDISTVGNAGTVLEVTGPIQIAETIGDDLRLVSLSPDGQIMDNWHSPMTMPNEIKIRLINESVISLPHMRIHKPEISGGRYAYVRFRPATMFESLRVVSDTAYPFTVRRH